LQTAEEEWLPSAICRLFPLAFLVGKPGGPAKQYFAILVTPRWGWYNDGNVAGRNCSHGKR